MKRTLIVILVFLAFNKIFSQFPSAGCDQSMSLVNTIFGPSTTLVYANTVTQEERLYLCEDNTTVYDTLHPQCRTVFINAGCSYITNSQGCLAADFIYVKNSGTLTVKANANSGSFRIYYEPNATIINQTNGVGTLTYSCLSIAFPTVNCALAGLWENSLERSQVMIYPNPSNGNFRIVAQGLSADIEEITLYNSIGEEVLMESTLFDREVSAPIRADLPNGIYFVKFRQKSGRLHYDKLVISK